MSRSRAALCALLAIAVALGVFIYWKPIGLVALAFWLVCNCAAIVGLFDRVRTPWFPSGLALSGALSGVIVAVISMPNADRSHAKFDLATGMIIGGIVLGGYGGAIAGLCGLAITLAAVGWHRLRVWRESKKARAPTDPTDG